MMPSPDEVNRLFNTYLDYFDIFGLRPEPLMSISTFQKWNCIKTQSSRDKTAPSSKWLHNKLRDNFSNSILEKINDSLCQYKITWCKQFWHIKKKKKKNIR